MMKTNSPVSLSFRPLVNVIKAAPLLLVLMVTLTSWCSLCHLPRFKAPCCIDGRRPQVMCSRNDWVWDYTLPCEEERKCCGRAKVPLTEEDFDPYRVIDREYRLSIGDILEISVFGDEETFVETVPVAADGCLYYAFLDGIQAVGRTSNDVSEEIESKLSHLFVKPIVTIIPKIANGMTFRILGRIQQPGLYPIQGAVRLRDAIGEAGGIYSEYGSDRSSLGDDSPNMVVANLPGSFIIRNGEKLDVDFQKLIFSADDSQNIYVRPGDYIYIAPNVDQAVFVLGAVLSPQRVSYSRGLTLMQVLTSGGGWISGTPFSPDMRHILVIRGSLDCPCVAQLNLCKILNGEARDLYLKPGDIVYVQDKPMRFGRELVRMAIETFVISFGSAAGGYYGSTKWFPVGQTSSSSK